MNLSQQDFFRIVSEISQRRIPVPQSSSEADNTSSYSDLLKLTCHPEALKGDRLTKLVLIASSMIGLNPAQEEEWKRRLAIIADKRNGQGEYKDVIELIYNVPFTPYDQLNWLYRKVGAHAFFGTEIVSILRLYNSFRFINPYILSKAPVKRPIKKRGYDDKGHLPESTYGHGNTVRAEPRPDREKIFNEEIPISETLYYNDIQPDLNNEQETLVEISTSEVFKSSNKKTINELMTEPPFSLPEDRHFSNPLYHETEEVSRIKRTKYDYFSNEEKNRKIRHQISIDPFAKD